MTNLSDFDQTDYKIGQRTVMLPTPETQLLDLVLTPDNLNKAWKRVRSNDAGRFKSQALLDEAALLSCMAYVDLNPVRAGMAHELLDSDFTSIQQRICDFAQSDTKASGSVCRQVNKCVKHQQKLKQDLNLNELPEAPLMVFDGSAHTDIHLALPFTREDYFDLVDVTGRAIRDDKNGAIAEFLRPIIQRLGIKPSEWLSHVQNFSRRYGACAGHVVRMQNYAEAHKKRWCKGIGVSRRQVA